MIFHSVRLDAEKCQGCTNCIKRCPTQAIRVRNKKAYIISDRCIDCGECIRVCPHHAKIAVTESFNELINYKYRIALPAPALYGQFNNLENVDYVLTGLKRMGFDSITEVSKGAELVSSATRMMLESGELQRPVISSACPAVLRLIRTRFPNLLPNLLPLYAPVDLAARLAREEAKKQTGLSDEEIGVFFISPCPAKRTATRSPLCYEKSGINGAIAIKDIYPVLVQTMDRLKPDELESINDSGIIGVSWAQSGGESAGLLKERYLAADGIENVINVLEELEDEKLNDLDFIELNCCTGGCVGGVLTVENPYIAGARLTNLRRTLPISRTMLRTEKGEDETFIPEALWASTPAYIPAKALGQTLDEAMDKMAKIEKIYARLPDHDCGSCGSPTCRTFAEDVVKGEVTEDQCIVNMRALIEELAKQIGNGSFGKE